MNAYAVLANANSINAVTPPNSPTPLMLCKRFWKGQVHKKRKEKEKGIVFESVGMYDKLTNAYLYTAAKFDFSP